jgi:hypothetical protein
MVSSGLLRRVAPPKRRFLQEQHGVTTQKTPFLIEMSVLTRATWRNIPEDTILHCHRRESRKSYIALIGWSVYRGSNASPVRYELDFCNPEDGLLHSHRRDNLKFYIALTGWTLLQGRSVSPVRYELGFYVPEDGILRSHGRENLKSQ